MKPGWRIGVIPVKCCRIPNVLNKAAIFVQVAQEVTDVATSILEVPKTFFVVAKAGSCWRTGPFDLRLALGGVLGGSESEDH